MSRPTCQACGAFVRPCEKCARRPSLAINADATKIETAYPVTVTAVIAWAQRREARGQSPGIEDFVADLREGKL